MSIDIKSLNRQLSQLITKPSVSTRRRPAFAVGILNKLREQPMTLELLLTTRVGMTVNNVRSLNWSEEVSQLALQIINEWKVLLPKVKENAENNDLLESSPPLKVKKRRIKRIIEDSDEESPNDITTENGINGSRGKSIRIAEPPVSVDPRNKTNNSVNKIKQLAIESNKENNPLNWSLKKRPLKRPLRPILKNKNKFISTVSEPRIKKFKKLPPIGQMPEYSAQRLRQRTRDNECTSFATTVGESSSSFDLQRNGVGGHQLYEKIVRKRKLERTSRMDSPRKRAMTFATVAIERYSNVDYNIVDKPKVGNWPVPHSIPILTPADRLKIIQTRNMERPSNEGEPQASTSKCVSFRDEHELELDVWRARSSKSLNKIIPRTEHKPKF